MKDTLIEFYEQYRNRVSAYAYATASIYFDVATKMPRKGVAYGNKMASILAGESFDYATDIENVNKIKQLYNLVDDIELKEELRLRIRDLDQICLLPRELYVAFESKVAESQVCWEEAKTNNDYSLFKPYLIELIKMKKEMIGYMKVEGSNYDFLLDQYQEGLNIKKYDDFFQLIKERLVPLIHQIKQSTEIDTSFLDDTYSIEKQREFAKVLESILHVDMGKCYIAESMHPFTSFFSHNDVRFTTKYHENQVQSAIFSFIHEYGHGLYGLQVDEKYEGTTIASNIGFAMHESQSRLLENHIGKHEQFWNVAYPHLQKLFSESLSDVPQSAFLNAINASKPSLIRIEADELTYPLHILIRYELEKEIIDNEAVDYENLDKLWDDKYEQYLGIRPTSYANGILQDVHWSAALFGYFPTYALGSAIAAQLFHQLEKDIDLKQVFETSRFDEITSWLHEHVHQYGALKTVDEILLDVTKEVFNPNYYIEYLEKKYKKLYNI